MNENYVRVVEVKSDEVLIHTLKRKVVIATLKELCNLYRFNDYIIIEVRWIALQVVLMKYKMNIYYQQ